MLIISVVIPNLFRDLLSCERKNVLPRDAELKIGEAKQVQHDVEYNWYKNDKHSADWLLKVTAFTMHRATSIMNVACFVTVQATSMTEVATLMMQYATSVTQGATFATICATLNVKVA